VLLEIWQNAGARQAVENLGQTHTLLSRMQPLLVGDRNSVGDVVGFSFNPPDSRRRHSDARFVPAYGAAVEPRAGASFYPSGDGGLIGFVARRLRHL